MSSSRPVNYADHFRGARPTGAFGPVEIWSYTSSASYFAGDEISLAVSTTASSFELEIYRDGAERETVHRATLPGTEQRTPTDAYSNGCDWDPSFQLEIPNTWRTGAYIIELTAVGHERCARHHSFFVIKPSPNAERPRVAMILATYTWQAYNDWGGGSAYSLDTDATEPPGAEEDVTADPISALRSASGFSPRLSTKRPWARGLIDLPNSAPRVAIKNPVPHGWAPRYAHFEWAYANHYSHWSGCAGWASFDGHFVRWAEQAGVGLDLYTQEDLDADSNLLAGYACVVTVGHDEYWSAAGRAALDRFIENGGRYARFAGNIMWRVRVEDAGDAVVCYKYVPELDPLAKSDQSSRTGAFESLDLSDPCVTTFGGNGGRGGYSRVGGSAPRGAGGFTVYRNQHWALEGTDLYYGDLLGADVPLVAYEADGVDYTFRNGLPYPTGEDGTPDGLEILALTPTTFEEEDHSIDGGFLFTGDGDVAFGARALFGADTPANRQRFRYGCAAITCMPKGAGEVFCGGSTEWPYALAHGDAAAERVVLNVLGRYSADHEG
jgi:hypothetical protein